ncbi:MAG: choice-of-anchor D domain-containing protein, partial [Candidatus Latescibacteria bacterium]|nr:choice-of-anchor D domain-containing protein [Candidatus Latescibacterota bacterium]
SALRIAQGSLLRLEPGETRALDLSYAPPARGPQADTLFWRAPGGIALLQVPLAGQGLAPDLRLSATGLDFGAVPVGGEARQVLTLGNQGTAPLQYRLDLKGGYRLGRAGEGELASGAAVQLPLSFVPTQRRAYADTLFIYSDVPETPVRQVLLSGRGGQPELAPLPASLDLGLTRTGQPRRYRLDLRGGYRLGRAGEGQLAPGAAVQLPLSFVPTQRRAYADTLFIYSDVPETPVRQVLLSGRGGQPELASLPASLDLGLTRTGQPRRYRLELRNAGEVDLHLDRMLTGSRLLLPAARRLAIPPGQTGVLELVFTPRDTSLVRGEITFATDDPARPRVSIPFAGQGSRTSLYTGVARHLFAPTVVDKGRVWELSVRNLHPRATLALQALAEGPFQLLQAPAKLGPGEQAVIQLEYRPTRPGTSRGRLVLNTDLKESLEIALEGRAQAPTTLSLGAPLPWAQEFVVPLELREARELNGLSLELALPEELEYAGMEFPGNSLAGQPLLLVDLGEEGRLGLGLSFAQPVSGEGVVGLLRLRLRKASPSPLVLAVNSAVVRSASGAADTLALPPPLEWAAGPVAKPALAPAALALYPPYPNPFNAEVALSYELPRTQPLSLVIYNAAGQQVRTLFSGIQEAGAYRLVWDGRDQQGRLAGSGIYLALLRAAEGQLSQQLLILH